MAIKALPLLITTFFLAVIDPTQACAQAPADPEAPHIQARKNFDIPASQHALQQAQTQAQNSTSVQTTLTLAYSALAVAELQRIVFEDKVGTPSEQRNMGKIIDAAAQIGLQALENLPDSSEKYRIRADLYGTMIRTKYQGKKFAKKMESATEKALELDPDNPNAQVTAAKKPLFATVKRGGDLDLALTHLNKALTLDPTHEMALILRGTAHEKRGDYPAAREDWQQALTQNPDNTPAQKNLQTLKEQGH